jgi:hypothetical protein
MTETPEETRARHDAEVLTHHTVQRDGAWWWCPRCTRVLGEFGQGMPATEADCVPRTWGDGAPA